MFRMKPKVKGASPGSPSGGSGGGGGGSVAEVRPGGMLVQQRTSDSNQGSKIKVRVKYESSYHEVTLSSQSSFGELKKMLVGPTGLRPHDQKLIYKEKERDSKAFLDAAGVKDGSKLVLIEDELSRERRLIEARRGAKMEKASKEIAAIRFEIDKLAKRVASIEMEVHGGNKVVEAVLLNLIELLMTQLIKLDGIAAEGDVKLQRRMQVKRVQKYIETLDALKIRNSVLRKGALEQHNKIYTGQMPIRFQTQQEQRKQGQGQ